MNDDLFDVAISFHIFNRPDSTRKVFEEIRKVKPKLLFVTADGPREGRPDDQEKCRQTRAIIDEVDWECELHTNFSDVNQGSFKSTSQGITWVFDHVEKAIILEDDCIPDNSFFTFCRELLDYYEKDTRISIISGNNFQLGKNKTKDSYYFSRYTHIWGWATWRRTWELVDFSMKDWPEYMHINGLKGSFSTKKELSFWTNKFQAMYDKRERLHWDFLLSLSSFMNNTLTIIPEVNLVTNIGYGPDASNCKVESQFHSLRHEEIAFPFKHPPFVSRFVDADDFTEKRMFSGSQKQIRRFLISYTPDSLVNFYRNIKRWVWK